MYQNAIVRTPSPSLISGLTSSAHLGKPDYPLALEQHHNYIKALAHCGLEIDILPALTDYPDACFVEDVALLTDKTAILTRPGAHSRQGEVLEIKSSVKAFYKERISRIFEPATLEAGDVLRIKNHFYIGLSQRTNQAGAEQLINLLAKDGYTASTIALKEYLHLKTGVSYLDQEYILVSGELIDHPAFAQFKQIKIDAKEEYAANCIMVNGTVIMPQNFPKTNKAISALGFPIIEVDVSEFRKVDGGLSCLSLRF